ncbi:TetR/AcrR family transcriptional regulator [Ktedonosporobacter rubrisoli]|uniref:TetR/AcrR family transcriptional regulator n=1 Tax=Ktedonosporobacter rubrisoli TaxID=2509675 RepID=A0A4P6K043_KTERU|nr:TetR/AcrR family transcriptional regulator [Ktedonosporobacter rubrisoli]QBD81295.1 TetR/AcrR family transcriptional regulator [Ktedonosporobacter rubrisoli]
MAKRGPRPGFDRNEALRKALLTFWENGYEGTTIAQLREAMGDLCAPSVYAAFGSKDTLFREVVELYNLERAPYWQQAFAEPSTRGAIEALLRGAAISYTTPDQPRGCLIDLGTKGSSPGNTAIQDYLRACRQEHKERIKKRLQQGIAAGELDPGCDVEVLANFYYAVLRGLSSEANDGASREALLAIVDTTMKAWPGSR